jgi:hypothetical protein
MWATSVIFKKLPIANKHPIGRNASHLVTLVAAEVFFVEPKTKCGIKTLELPLNAPSQETGGGIAVGKKRSKKRTVFCSTFDSYKTAPLIKPSFAYSGPGLPDFFLVQYTNTGENIPIYHKLYQKAMKYFK